MSQVPGSAASEPLPGETPPASAQAGTAAGGGAQEVEQLRADAAKFKAEAERLKGFQSLYTQGKQSGVWDAVEGMVKGTNPEGAKAKWQELEQAKQVADEVQKMGGIAVLRDYHDIFSAANQPPAAAPAAPNAAPVQGFTEEQIRAMTTDTYTSLRSKEQVASAKTAALTQVAEKLGFPLTEDSTRKLLGALDRELESVTQGVRDPLTEEVGQAGQRLLDWLTAVRTTAPETPGQPAPAAAPVIPAMNGRVPSGQAPPLTPRQMTPAQRRDAAMTMARQERANMPAPVGAGGEEIPMDTIHSYE